MNLWWDVFNVAESPLGGWFPNVMRLLTVILIIMLTIYRARLPLATPRPAARPNA